MRFILFLLGLLIFTSCDTSVKKAPNLLDCVPQNSLAAFQLNDQNMLENALTNLPFLTEIIALDSSLNEDIKTIIPPVFSSKALLCFTPEGKSEIALSFIYKINPSDSLPKLSGDLFLYNNTTIRVSQKNQRKIYSTTLKGLQIISTSQLVLENSIRNIQNKRPGIQNQSFFDLAEISDDNAPMSVLLHRDFNTVLHSFFPETPLFPSLGNHWFSFDFNTKKDPFTLDGVSFINDSLPDELSLLKGLNPQRLVSSAFVPQNFDGFLVLAVDDYKTLEDNFKQFSRFKNIPLPEINFDPLSAVDEIAWLNLQENKALFFHLTNNENINPILFSNSESKGSYRGLELYNQKLTQDLLALIEVYGTPINPKWGVQLEEFLIFAENETFLKQIIGAHLDGKTLANDLNFKNLREDLADNSTFLWLGRTKNLIPLWNKNLDDSKDAWKKINLKKYPLIALQGVSEFGFIQTRITAQNNDLEENKRGVSNQYSFSLDAPVSRAPQWIKNHRNKTMDIVVQDQNNVLYLFSNTGTLFWKKQLSSAIVGEIYQVDLYKNRRLQMAFQTADRFIILDRNGKTVAPFNIKVSDETPKQFAVFDYDLNRNYRFLLSQGKQLQMFDNRGKKVTGFQLKKLKQPLQNPPKHIRMGTKDYIILQKIDGQVRILNRQGKDRVFLKSNANTSNNPVFAYRNTFASTNKDGNLIQIDTKGNLTESTLNLRPGHTVDMTSKSLVSFSENTLLIKGIPVELPFGNYTAPKIHYINNTIYVTLTDLDTQKVYAFYSNGTSVNGFPVYGNSKVALTNADDDKALEMVVQSEEDSFLIYQIN
jgi:hypothetical protein